MVVERFVVAGLARARTDWFRAVASWSTSGALPTDFVKCVSAEELRTLMAGGRAFSAALLDAGLPSVDRDLVAALREEGVAPLFVESSGVRREWHDLGAAAVLPATFTREQLMDALRATASPISAGDVPGFAEDDHVLPSESEPAPVISVCGAGGTGSSVVAIALAQGLASRRQAAKAGSGLPVVLADLCLRADQAALHDARDIVPGVQELVEAHRNRRLEAAEIQGLTFRVTERDYHVLLGLRRAVNWTAIRPRAFEAALRGLRQSFSYVVADLEPDLESEQDTGSIDIEERNVLARTTVSASSVVVVVGRGGIGGLHGMVRCVSQLTDHGVAPERILPVCTPGPRGAAQRAEFSRAFADLVDVPTGSDGVAGMVFLPRRKVDDALRDGVRMPRPLPDTLAGAVLGLLQRQWSLAEASEVPQPIRPGSLGLSGH